MGRKHLHQLLQEDQEPFHLKSFIADRRSLLKSTTTNTRKKPLQPTKLNRIIESTSSASARNHCLNHVCLFSLQDSPEFKRSPFPECPAMEMKSPCNNTTFFLHIPSSTAAMLLDAAMRVQKPKSGSKHVGFGLVGSLLRRLKDRSTSAKSREIGPVNVMPSSPPTRKSLQKSGKSGMDVEGDGDVNISSGWPEKCLGMETACTIRSILDSEDTECLCSNPSSPFRFSLQRSPSPPRLEPDSSSTVASPSRHFQPDKEGNGEAICLPEDVEKEQCSPVSVLDPLFDDDEDSGVMEDDGGGGVIRDNNYDIECGYVSVQRAKNQLLQKLQRFERLAGLDPIELEKHMLEQCYEENDEDDDEDVTVDKELVTEIVKIPWYMRKPASDCVSEEKKNQEPQVMMQRVSKGLHASKMVKLNTIDMMVEAEFVNEGWRRCDSEKIREIGMDIEGSILGFLVEELAEEVVNFSEYEQ